MLISSSVGVNPGSCFVSSGLPISDVGVSTEGTGRVGSSEDGYERGSVRRDGALERDDIDELDDARDGAMSLFMVESVDVDMLDAIDSRE